MIFTLSLFTDKMKLIIFSVGQQNKNCKKILRLHFQRNNHRGIVTLQISVVINRDAGSSSFSIESKKSVHYKFSAGDEGKNCEQEQPLIARV